MDEGSGVHVLEVQPSVDVLVIDGVRFSREVLLMLARPEPSRWLRLRRVGDDVQVETRADT